LTRSDSSCEWPTVEAALDELLALPEHDRAAALERRTAGCPGLRQILESLLAHTDGPDELLDKHAIDALVADTASVTADISGTLPAGTRIGAYRILGLIGRGGMGEVYRAERADGQFEQIVAVKLIRLEPGGSLARFQAERQIVAELDHPGIARLLDGGVLADGRPYMIMEYVDGLALNVWCDTHHASLGDRLALFLQVCEAVEFAHAHLVVHRDLKSANIVVTAEGRTKLLDFGIAKLLQADTTGDATRTTHLSPAHAAPEQLMGGAITTATDVYGLGVTLYQLLCGRLPWHVTDLPLAVAVRRLLDEKLVPPSLGVVRGGSVTARELRGDLDAIVAKALRKEPRARYPDARALATDIARHLRHEPVLARAGARAYVLRSFVRRHWLPLASLTLVFLVLLGGILGTAWQATVARRQAHRAELEAGKATAVKNFLLDIFKQSSLQNPGGVEARNVTAEKLLDIGAQRIRVQLHEQTEVRGELLDTLASLYDALGNTDSAVALAQERIEDLRGGGSGANGLDWAKAHVTLARALIDAGHEADALPQLDTAQRTLDAIGDHVSVTRAEIEFHRARAAYDGSVSDQAAGLRHLRQALDILEPMQPHDALYGDVLEYFGYYAQIAGDYAGAEVWKKRLLAFEQSQGADRNAFAIGNAYLDLGDAQALAREYDASESNLRQAVVFLSKSAGPDHPTSAMALSRLGEMYFRSGRPVLAEPLLLQALQLLEKTPQGREDRSETIKTLGTLALARGKLAEAESLLRQNVAHLRANQNRQLRYGASDSVLASVLTAKGNFSEAEQHYAAASDIYRKYNDAKAVALAGCLVRGADLALAEGKLNQAADLYEQIRRGWPPVNKEFPEMYARATVGLARTELRQGRSELAHTHATELLHMITTSEQRRYLPDQEAQAARLVGEASLRLGQVDAAEEDLRRAVELRQLLDDPDSFWLAEARITLAEDLIVKRRLPEAQRLLELAAAAQSRQSALGPQYRQPLREAQLLFASTIKPRDP
jgi:hypothetical protein